MFRNIIALAHPGKSEADPIPFIFLNLRILRVNPFRIQGEGKRTGANFANRFARTVGGAVPLFFLALAPMAHAEDSVRISDIEVTTLRENRDGSEGTTWFHPRAAMVPSPSGTPRALMCLQTIGGSDYFGPVHWSESSDEGKTWTEPSPIKALGRVPVRGYEGLEAGVCDVVPQYHAPTNTVLAMGHVVFYRGPKFSRKDQLPRYPVYSIRDAKGNWSERKILKWDDPRGAFIYTNNCGQRVVDENGDILMSFTFGPNAAGRSVAGVRCDYDGKNLTIAEVGPSLTNSVNRGLLEPSVTRFQDRFYMTIRAEDERGYVSVSDDGVNYAPQKSWAWEDGEPLTMSTTQQHWLTHSDGLFLVYTRKDAVNTAVMRWRSPLWVAQVDLKTLTLIRETEKVVIPLHGDGVNEPDTVPLMGNFHITNASPDESWVTVGEWMPKNGALGNLMLSKLKWSKPNRLAPK